MLAFIYNIPNPVGWIIVGVIFAIDIVVGIFVGKLLYKFYKENFSKRLDKRKC